jgi:hypothetical protein
MKKKNVSEKTEIAKILTNLTENNKKETGTKSLKAKIEEGQTETTSFKGKELRRVFHKKEWYYCIVDIIAILTGSVDPNTYLKKMRNKKRDEGLSEIWGTITVSLAFKTAGGKQKINCSNAENIFRIIQSIPSPKAEPFKQWFAKVAYERIEEIQNPEIAILRTRALYKANGHSDEWITNRIKSIFARKGLTDTWKEHDVKENREYAILTDIINKETFEKDVKKHKEYKGLLDRDNLRDHMNPIELALTTLAETATEELTKTMNRKGFELNKEPAKEGGKIAGNARKELEDKLGKPVVTPTNYLTEKQKQGRLKKTNK